MRKLLNIDRLSSIPVYEQIVEQMQKLILTGAFRPEEQIPSVRALSLELSINPNTIQKAYNELDLRGVTSSVPGVGRFVSKNAEDLLLTYFKGKLRDLRETIFNLALAGVDKQDVTAMIKSAYEGAQNFMEMRNKA
jgi:GntR family transcriptional regulator